MTARQRLATANLAELAEIFADAPAPSAALRQGFWRAYFIGPWWLRLGGRPGVSLSGLWGWQGKAFLTPDRATNILIQRGEERRYLTMACHDCVSWRDGRPVAALTYGLDAPLPWRWVTDELRVLDNLTLLGMTRINLPGLSHLSLPFLLERTN